jgi:mRNA interferase MazF
MPEQGYIVLIPVPFTDLSSRKKRPVVIISSDDYNRAGPDVIVVAMTSRPAISPHGFQITSADLVQGSLNRPGTVRADKVYTLARAIIVKKFGKVSPAIVERIRRLLDSITTPSP